jgi:hypothetical protein
LFVGNFPERFGPPALKNMLQIVVRIADYGYRVRGRPDSGIR